MLATSGEPTGVVSHTVPRRMAPAGSSASSLASPPEMSAIMAAVGEMLAVEYKATPQRPDVNMDPEKPILDQIHELEGQAAELLTRAAYLRQKVGLPVNRLFQSSKNWPDGQRTQGPQDPSRVRPKARTARATIQMPPMPGRCCGCPDCTDVAAKRVGCRCW